jgi:histidinol-phosphate phosphatase family protein
MKAVGGLDDVDIVVPTIGRPSLRNLLASIEASCGPRPRAIFVVDDRSDASELLRIAGRLGSIDERVGVLRGVAQGPASARNIGWRMAAAPWVAFLDDDVTVTRGWLDDLARDLRGLHPGVAGSQGRVTVPLPTDRRPTDWERNVGRLATARWATADMAYRRTALEQVGGFDARFPHAYREDADLALRVLDAGYAFTRGRRMAVHPVGPADRRVSVRLQRGNADDMLMRALHGPAWRSRAGAPRGRFRRHAATVAGAAIAVGGAATGRTSMVAAGAATWLAGTAELAAARIRPGPRDPTEMATMVVTSAALPFAAVGQRLRGVFTLPGRLRDRVRAPQPASSLRAEPPLAVLLDRDGTIVVDVPYNGDPDVVEPVAGAGAALQRLRAAGMRLAVVSNQSGVARGLITADDVAAVNARIEETLGPLGPFCICSHGESDGCVCRKPAPGLVLEAARRLDVAPARCVVIGDTGADVDAARGAGARAILVPNQCTRREEVDAAPEVAEDLAAAIDMVLGPARDDSTRTRPLPARPTELAGSIA